jgi:hypothetical protein
MSLSSRIGLGRWMVLLALVLSLGLAGCGASKGTVSGKVYYKDDPLKGGTVMFIRPDKQSYLAEIREDGSYAIEKLPPGEVSIVVETASLKPPNPYVLKNKPSADAGEGYKPTDFAARAKRFVPIPERYFDPDKSGLKYAVKGGKQVYDIKLN